MLLSAVPTSISIVAYLALFVAAGLVFLFINLVVGWLVRPNNPHVEKGEIYECGEPTIGSSFVQFDLRFYVVALLFIIFDVEIAFFFPWATVFGKASHLANDQLPVVQAANGGVELTPTAAAIYREMGVADPVAPTSVPASMLHADGTAPVNASDPLAVADFVVHQGAEQLMWVTILDIGVFFAVLMVGFAYVWRRGDLDWVRAVTAEEMAERGELTGADADAEEPALSA